MKRLASALLVLPVLVGCGGDGGTLGSDNGYTRSYTGTYSRAIASAPNTSTATGSASYAGVRRTVVGDATFKLTLGAEGALTGTVDTSGDATGVVFAHATTTGTESIAVSDLKFTPDGNVLDASFDATVSGEADLYTVRLVRG